MNRVVVGSLSAFALLVAMPSYSPFHAGSSGPGTALAQEEGHGGGGGSGRP